MAERLKYVLITPARNEEAFIGATIESVISQSHLPERWIIVSDGSTDRTDEIVRGYKSRFAWIELLRMPEHRDRQFASKVNSFNAGYALLEGCSYDVIGNVDADVTFPPDYFEFIMSKFALIPSLGVAGTPFQEQGYRSGEGAFANLDHVSGACQLFRRECFEQIGGYIPIKGGGIDWAAVTSARMRGWVTRTFKEKTFVHHRKMGTGSSGFLMSRFNHGRKDHYLGGHPLWELFRGVYQMSKKPYVIAGLYLLAGYFWSFLSRTESPLPAELIRFHRAEQMARLRGIFGRVLSRGKNANKNQMEGEGEYGKIFHREESVEG